MDAIKQKCGKHCLKKTPKDLFQRNHNNEKDQDTIVNFNKNFLTKLSFSYFEFIKKNSGLSLDSLYTQFNEINKETLHACLRQLIDDSKISYKDQLFY